MYKTAAAAAKSLQSCPTRRPHRQQPTRLPRPWDSPGKNTGVGCHFLLQCMKVKSESEDAQSYPTLNDPMDCSPTGSPVHGIFQARVLEWGATHCLLHLSIFNKIPRWEFPGGPVVKTQCFQCSGLGSTPGGETTILCPPPQKKNPRH